jgi:hypothetical protein
MTLLICDVCQLPLMCREDPTVEALVLELHRCAVHPDVLPWACSNCFYVPPGVQDSRCTDIHDGVSCMMYRPRPVWLRL